LNTVLFCCGKQNKASRDKAIVKSEEIKPVATAVIELRLPENKVSQYISQSVENKNF